MPGFLFCFLKKEKHVSDRYDVVIIGGGAAGMMCAASAGQRGRSVLLIEHGAALGEKIRISGGGRCNFTNVHTSPKQFLSGNPHFCISALNRYSAADFIQLVEAHGISYHEKKLGQLFCDHSSSDILTLLKTEMSGAGVDVALASEVGKVRKSDDRFSLELVGELSGEISCSSLVIATGGKSIPKMGATGFGYQIAGQFGLDIIEPRPGLVPLTFDETMLAGLKPLSGVGVDSRVQFEDVAFDEALLFTHRGLSGPAILQISSYWREGADIEISLLPETDFVQWFEAQRQKNGKKELSSVLGALLPKRVVSHVLSRAGVSGRVGELGGADVLRLASCLQSWILRPMGSEGYRTAEVTIGGVDTGGLSSKTMEARAVPGLYFIGEVVDVTGWLGGYNFQWAWSSGWVAGQAV